MNEMIREMGMIARALDSIRKNDYSNILALKGFSERGSRNHFQSSSKRKKKTGNF
ncbi:hypothetical protein [Bacillus sp. SD075]|uniref:hypothetical protein n=1 Tax=Bacillus sp. SD075 TaxID=2781732 RepID=UPI002570565E|nr:hypothetical protein [Bacillus sp. SD075]